MKRKEVDVLGEQTNAPVIKLPERRFPGVVLQGDSLHILRERAAKVSTALSAGRPHDAGEDAAELYELLDGYVDAYEDAIARAGMELPYVKRRSTGAPRGGEAEPDSDGRRAATRPAEVPAGLYHDFSDPHSDKLLEAAERVIYSLAQARGIDAEAVADLRQALQEAAKAWASSGTIPKASANLFVDLAWGIEARSHAYPGPEAEDIRRLADEIADLVRQCVALE